MASISVNVRTPKVPDHLYLHLPDRVKPVRVSLSQLSTDDLDTVARAWAEKLVERRSEIIVDGLSSLDTNEG